MKTGQITEYEKKDFSFVIALTFHYLCTMMNDNEFAPLSPLRCGARNGLRFGVYLTVFYAASLFSRQAAVLNLLSLVMIVAVPFVVYFLMKADYRAVAGRYSVGSLWLDGMTTVVCGSLVAGVFMLAYLRWINPTHLSDEWTLMASTFAESPDASVRAYGEQLQSALDNGFTLSPGVFTMTLVWMAGFTGSLLALALALLVKRSDPGGKSPADIV